jgi:hypothetical protein
MKKKNGREVPNCVPSKGVPKAKGYKKEEVDRAEYEKVATEPAPKDDKKSAYAFKDNKKRQKDLKKLARLVRHADGQKRNPALYNSFESEGEVIDEAMSSYDRNRKRAAERAAARNAARDAGKTGVVPGVGYVTPRRERETYTDSAGVERHKSGARMPQKEEVEQIEERAMSRAQQRFMGMVYAAKKGEPAASPEVAQAAAGMSKKEAKKFAKTKHKGLPEKKKISEQIGIDASKTPQKTPEKLLQKLAPNYGGGTVVKSSVGMQKAHFEPEGELVDEAAEDRARDEHQMRGGMSARVDYDRPPAKKKTNKEMGIRDFTPAEKEARAKQMSAHLKKMGRS